MQSEGKRKGWVIWEEKGGEVERGLFGKIRKRRERKVIKGWERDGKVRESGKKKEESQKDGGRAIREEAGRHVEREKRYK